jgi:hypothetical protein
MLPLLSFDMLKYPVTCYIHEKQLIFQGGEGGSEYMCAVAKLAIQSYIKHKVLPGWDSVSVPLLYKMHSECSWEDISSESMWATMNNPETLARTDSSPLVPEKRQHVSEQVDEPDEPNQSRPTTVLRRLRLHGKRSVPGLMPPGAHSDGAGLSAQVVSEASVGADGAGLSAQVVSEAIVGAGLSAQIGIEDTGVGTLTWPEVGAGLAARGCGCRGICGDKFCKSMQNKLTRKGRKVQATDVFCPRVPRLGLQLCKICMCEFCKEKPRSKTDVNGRWCDACVVKVNRSARLAYVTRCGHHNYNPSWPREIKFICKFNYVFHMLDPGDVAACEDACNHLWCRFGPPVPGQQVHFMVLFTLVWIHALKWPAAVHHFGRSLGQYKPSADVVQDLVVMIKDSILHCAGQVWDDVFAGMQSGGATFSHGPVALGKQ